MKRFRSCMLAVMLAAMVLSLTACGSRSSADKGTTGQTATTGGTETAGSGSGTGSSTEGYDAGPDSRETGDGVIDGVEDDMKEGADAVKDGLEDMIDGTSGAADSSER